MNYDQKWTSHYVVHNSRPILKMVLGWLLLWRAKSAFRARGVHNTHFLYSFFDGKKTTRSQFIVPGLREIHRNLKQEKKFNSRESFFRKSPFCTFSCINPGFGRLWEMLRKKILTTIFIVFQKNAFGQKKFECPRVCQIQDLFRKKCKKGIF